MAKFPFAWYIWKHTRYRGKWLLLFLSFNEIPPVNKDIFVTVTGMVVGSLSVVIYTIIGRNADEVANLTKKVESLENSQTFCTME